MLVFCIPAVPTWFLLFKLLSRFLHYLFYWNIFPFLSVFCILATLYCSFPVFIIGTLVIGYVVWILFFFALSQCSSLSLISVLCIVSWLFVICILMIFFFMFSEFSKKISVLSSCSEFSHYPPGFLHFHTLGILSRISPFSPPSKCDCFSLFSVFSWHFLVIFLFLLSW